MEKFSFLEPWIFSGTIKENILFGLDYDAQKFNRCLYATSLSTVRFLLNSSFSIEIFLLI